MLERYAGWLSIMAAIILTGYAAFVFSQGLRIQ
jgi:hypothetical protein